MMKIGQLVLVGAAVAAMSAHAEAQERHYDLHEMNFDMWCQEEQHLPPDRCDRRLPQDDADFQTYRNTIEKYEIPYLQRRQDEQTLNRTIIHDDPVDHPTLPSQPQANRPPQ